MQALYRLFAGFCCLLLRYFVPVRWVNYCDQCICMSVCLSTCVCSHLKNPHVSITCYLWLCFVLIAVQYVMYFRLCGWRHGFTWWREWARIKDGMHILSSSPGGGTGGKVCLHRLNLVFYWLLGLVFITDAGSVAAGMGRGYSVQSRLCLFAL